MSQLVGRKVSHKDPTAILVTGRLPGSVTGRNNKTEKSQTINEKCVLSSMNYYVNLDHYQRCRMKTKESFHGI